MRYNVMGFVMAIISLTADAVCLEKVFIIC